MGKGDKRTAKGKRKVGSYGNSRQKATQKAVSTTSPTDVKKKVVEKKVVEKKVVEKKPAPKKK